MTLDQALLAVLVTFTALGVGVAVLANARQAKWRQFDLLCECQPKRHPV